MYFYSASLLTVSLSKAYQKLSKNDTKIVNYGTAE